MPSKLEVISLGGRLARSPRIHMTVSGLSRARQCGEKEIERGGIRKRQIQYRRNQIEIEGGKDGWLGPEWWALLYLSSATDRERGSSGPVVIALCSRLILYNKHFKLALTLSAYFTQWLCFITVFFSISWYHTVQFFSVYVWMLLPPCRQNWTNRKTSCHSDWERSCIIQDDCTHF